MSLQTFFPQHQDSHYLWTASFGFLKILIPFALPLLISACAPAVITEKDRAAIHFQDKMLVLVRVLCTVDDKPFEPCIFRRNASVLSDRRFVGFAMGSFDTFGEPGSVKIQALSDESFDEGWVVFVLSPGIYYLYIRGPDSSESSHTGSVDYYSRHYLDASRWRIDVPERAKIIYAGTLTLAGKEDGELMFGDKIIVPARNQEVTLSDDRESAKKLFIKHFPDAGQFQTILMQRWPQGNPYIFRSPLPGPK